MFIVSYIICIAYYITLCLRLGVGRHGLVVRPRVGRTGLISKYTIQYNII